MFLHRVAILRDLKIQMCISTNIPILVVKCIVLRYLNIKIINYNGKCRIISI